MIIWTPEYGSMKLGDKLGDKFTLALKKCIYKWDCWWTTFGKAILSSTSRASVPS